MNIDIARRLIETGNLSFEKMLHIGKEVNDSSIWDAIVRKLNFDNLTNEQLLVLAKKANHEAVWSIIAKKMKFEGLTSEQLLKIGLQEDDTYRSILKVVVKKLKLKGMTNKELIEIGRKLEHFQHKHPHLSRIDSWGIVIPFLKLDGLTNGQLLTMLNQEKSHVERSREVLSVIVQKLELDNLTVEELLKIGKKADTVYVWDRIIPKLKLDNLTAEQLREIIDETTDARGFLDAIDGKFNFEHFLQKTVLDSNLSSENHLNLLLKIGRANKWEMVAPHLNLKGLANDQLLEIGNYAESVHVWKKIAPHLNLKGLANDQLLEIGKNAHLFLCKLSEDVWKVVALHLNLKGLSNDQLLKLAERANSEWVWKAIAQELNLGHLTLDELVEFGERIDNLDDLDEFGHRSASKEAVWKRVLAEIDKRKLGVQKD